LKALYVKNIDTKVPYKHNLPLLAKKAGIELNDEQESFFEMVSDFNIEEGILPMAERVNRIRKIIKNYIGIMLKNNIKVEKVYLYGSYALGKASGGSDIDIAVVSKDFSGDRFMDRRRIVPLRREVDRRLEPMPYHPDDFKESDPLVLEILQHGLEIL
jgi:predicted nucleotidyltransferase